MSTFYGFIDNMDWNNGLSQKFYTSIEDCVLDGNDRGEIVEFTHQDGSVPKWVRNYSVHSVELDDLKDWLIDEPEMNEDNFMVFSNSDEGYEDTLTIVRLAR